MRRRASQWAVAAAGAALLATALTWPLVPRLGSAGRIDSGDWRFSVWNVAWVARTIVVDPAHLLDANIFHPHTSTLAYSEMNLGAGILAVPAWWATRNAVAAHNSVQWLSFVLSALATYALARHVTQNRSVSIVAAVAFAFCPYVFAHFPHIQLQMTFGLPLSLLCLHRLVERPSAARGLALGGALFVQALCCGYYGLASGLAVALGLTYYAVTRRTWREPKFWLASGLAFAATVALVVPLALPYRELGGGAAFGRSLQHSGVWVAMWTSWLASPAWAHRWMLPHLGTWYDVLFPGFLPTLLGLGAMALLAARALGRGSARHASPRDSAASFPEAAGFYGLLGGLAAWTSFGPAAGLYSVLYYAVPGFSLLQAPSRFGILTILALAVLSALLLAEAGRRLSKRAAGRLTLGCIAALVLELAVVPVPLVATYEPDPAYRLLARLPRAPLVEFPFFGERHEFWRHTEYVLNSVHHWQPLLNGYSDYFPADYRDMAPVLARFPSPDAYAVLEARRVRYLAFQLRLYDRATLPALERALREGPVPLRLLSRSQSVWLYEVVDWER